MKRKQDPVDLTIETLLEDGMGLATDGRHAVLGGLPGEEIRALPVKRYRKRRICRIESVSQPSPHRVTPECGVADVCGGCSLQHLAHDQQMESKSARFLAQFDVSPEEVLPPLMGPRYHYRSKARLGARWVEKKGRVLVGFREKLTGYVTETDTCSILSDPVGNLLGELGTLIGSLSDPGCVPQIEVAGGDTVAALIFRHLEPFSEPDRTLLSRFGQNTGLQIFLQPGNAQSVEPLFPIQPEKLYYDLPAHELRLFFGPLDFTQINLAINRMLVDRALELLAPREEDVVLDAFCGIGNFSLPVARQVKTVIGLEGAEASIERARFNASQNHIDNVEFDVVDLHQQSVGPCLAAHGVTKVLIDPPRSGAEMLAKTLADSDVLRVVYVSCNPVTLARDAAVLRSGGFHFDKAGIIDMFPHTAHIESIAQFTR